MSDKVIGIAVLKGDELWVVCGTHQGNGCDITRIPVRSAGVRGEPKSPLWIYYQQGNVLSITPSLHVRCQFNLPDETWTTTFHNSYEWSVPFVVISDPTDGYEHCLELNRERMEAWRSGQRDIR